MVGLDLDDGLEARTVDNKEERGRPRNFMALHIRRPSRRRAGPISRQPSSTCDCGGRSSSTFSCLSPLHCPPALDHHHTSHQDGAQSIDATACDRNHQRGRPLCMKRSSDHTEVPDGDRDHKAPRLAATTPPSLASTMAEAATPPASSGEVAPSTPSTTRKMSSASCSGPGSGTFNPQRSPSNTIKIQGLKGCPLNPKGKGKLGSPSGIGMGNAKGLDGKGGLMKGGFGSGFVGRSNETKKLVVKNASSAHLASLAGSTRAEENVVFVQTE